MTYLFHVTHDRELLSVNEGLQHHSNSHVDIIFMDILPQMHAGMSLSHADHALNVTYSDGNTACQSYIQMSLTAKILKTNINQHQDHFLQTEWGVKMALVKEMGQEEEKKVF